MPLVLVFHAAGGKGRSIARHTGFTELAEQEGFAVAYPDGIGGRWNDGRRPSSRDDVGFVRALLDSLSRELTLDSNRVYAAGISNGAMFSYRLACDLPGVFAAIAPVAGALPANLPQRCVPAMPLSVVAFQGTADRSLPYDGGGSPPAAVLSAERSVAFWAGAGACDSAGADDDRERQRDRRDATPPSRATRAARRTARSCSIPSKAADTPGPAAPRLEPGRPREPGDQRDAGHLGLLSRPPQVLTAWRSEPIRCSI